MFQANAMGIFGLVSVAMCWALAVVLYRAGSTGSMARKLALLLVVEGVVLGTSGYIDLLLTPAATASSWYPVYNQAQGIVHNFGDCMLLALYPPFLAAALHTKLTRPFAGKRMRIGLGVVSVTLFSVVILTPPEIGLTVLYASMSLLFGFALVASIHAWAVAAPGIARTRAGIFALAFGLRDICWGFIYIDGISVIARGLLGEPEPDFYYVIYASGTFFAVPLIAYGIMRTHLFNIDLRIRWTIKQSTLAAIIVVIMFVLSEGAERLLSSELGNVGGLIVAALIVFALTPLHRFAERIASAAMPNTENTPEYIAGRKSQVYEAAFSEAQEGGISKKERALLVRLRDSLGISASEADAIEGELHKHLPGFA